MKSSTVVIFKDTKCSREPHSFRGSWGSCLKDFDTFTRTSVRVSRMNAVACAQLTFQMLTLLKQGKSEGFDSCNLPGNFTQIGYKLSVSHPMWPWNLMNDLNKIIGYLFYTTSRFVHHFKWVGELKLELQSGNTRFGSKSVIFLVSCDFRIWWMTLENNRPPLLYHIKLCSSF